jgi:hypothetical protein
MDNFLTFSIISILVSLAVPFFMRKNNFHYFSILVVSAGALLAIWATSKTEVQIENYIRAEIDIEQAVFDKESGSLEIFTDGQSYTLRGHDLIESDIDLIEQQAPNLSGQATIWMSPDRHSITGISALNLTVDPVVIAERESSFYKRLRNVGLGLAILGLLLIPFHYFTSAKQGELGSLTQKY